jgi:Flp pilus assembly protein TadD
MELATPFAESDDPALLDTLGWAHYRSGNYAEAVRYLERAVAKAGEHPVSRYHLGMAYLAAGDREAATRELTEAIARPDAAFPERQEAEATLARLNLASGSER